MTVKELINKLETVEDKNLDITVDYDGDILELEDIEYSEDNEIILIVG